MTPDLRFSAAAAFLLLCSFTHGAPPSPLTLSSSSSSSSSRLKLHPPSPPRRSSHPAAALAGRGLLHDLNDAIARDSRRLEEMARKQRKRAQDIMLRRSVHSSAETDRDRDREANAMGSHIWSGESSGVGQYFVDVSLGSPPQQLSFIVDTGSDLTWVKCSHSMNNTEPPPPPSSSPSSTNTRSDNKAAADADGGEHTPTFMATASSSYRTLPCISPWCWLVPPPLQFTCYPIYPQSCHYEYTYADGSRTTGNLALETASLPGAHRGGGIELVRAPGIVLGCALHEAGHSFDMGSSGVLGLGRGPLSFPSQLSSSMQNPTLQRFSYCLMDFFEASRASHNSQAEHQQQQQQHGSYLRFGDLPDPADGLRLHYTPLLNNPIMEGLSYYYVGVERVTLDGRDVGIGEWVWAMDELGHGGTIVDTGTTLTYLPRDAYGPISEGIRAGLLYLGVGVLEWGAIDDEGKSSGFELCFNASVEVRQLPKLGICFRGAEVCLEPQGENYFVEVAAGVRCLGIMAADPAFGVAVLGNLFQQNFLIEMDTQAMRMGFLPAHCSSNT